MTAFEPPSLPILPDAPFRRVLFVAAHPDDIEYSASAAVAAWTARGVEVSYLILTRGESGMDGTPPEEAARLRTAEQIAAGRAVGVSDVVLLDHPDGVLEYSLGLRRDVARAVRRVRPDAVAVGSWDVEFLAGLNQADHRVAGLVTIDAVRDAGNRWVFPELLGEGLEPWSTRWVLVAADTRPTHGVDVSGEPLERGIASLEAHSGYLGSLTGHPPVRVLLTAITAYGGPAIGTLHAVLFRALDLQAPPAFISAPDKR
jgi:LmbE family N-acetylglucosaminyl deacetylase